MSDNYPPYGGQPDPNVTPWSGPPAQQGGYPAYGQPGQPGQPGYQGAGYPGGPQQFGAPPPQKSNKGLFVGLGIGAAVLLILAVCGVGGALLLTGNDDDDPGPVATGPAEPGGDTSPGPDESPAPEPSPTQQGQEQPSDDAITARFSSDMSSVCDGSPILNAAAYSGASGAKAYTFSNAPDRPNNWSTRSVSSNKPYYARSTEFTQVSVVGCLKFTEGSQGEPRECEYKDSSDKQIKVKYISGKYTLTFYAAKTGEKIGDGGTVNAPANRCPSFISYNRQTMESYAAPDSGTIESALDKFLS